MNVDNADATSDSPPNIFCSPIPVDLDHSYSVNKSPAKLTKHVQQLTARLNAKVTALRNARKRECRLQGRVADLLKRVKNMQLLTNKAEELLAIYDNIPLKLLSGKRGSQFTEEQKQFAITLHYYSPAAYKFIRCRFKLLPGPRTIRGWLSSHDGNPGLTK